MAMDGGASRTTGTAEAGADGLDGTTSLACRRKDRRMEGAGMQVSATATTDDSAEGASNESKVTRGNSSVVDRGREAQGAVVGAGCDVEND